MPTEGTPVFNAVALLEIDTVSWAGGNPALTGHAAYVSTKSGKTYGRTTVKTGWSENTLRLLEELRASMEEDVAKLVFEQGTSGPVGTKNTLVAVPKGIGEHLEPEQI